MTFIEFETSEEDSRPAELFDFRIGLLNFPFTSYGVPVTVAVGTFNPDAIRRSKIKAESTSREVDLDVIMPESNPFVQEYAGTLGITGGRPSLTLYRTHINDPDKETRVRYRGEVTNISRRKDGESVTVHVQSILRTQSRPIPRQTFRANCDRSLYDDQCNADGTVSETDPAFEKFLLCSAVSDDGTVLTLDGAGAFGDDFFQAGFCQFGTDFRTIKAQQGAAQNDVVLRVPFQGNPLGSTIRALAGCQHRLAEDCQAKFANEINYGGDAFIPLKDIWTTGIQ